jgi:hypothetical protein
MKLADSEGAVLGHIGRLFTVGLQAPPAATAGCLCICVPMTNVRIIATKALKIGRGLNMERKLLTVFRIFGYGIICALQVRDIVRHSPTAGETRSQPQELLKNYIALVFI